MQANDEFAVWQEGMSDPAPNIRIRHAGKWINWQSLPKAAIPVLTKAQEDDDLTVQSYAASTLAHTFH